MVAASDAMREGGGLALARVEDDEGVYERFLEALPAFFDDERCNFLLSHYLWDDPARLEMLVRHLRLADLVRRVYLVTRNAPPPPAVLRGAVRRLALAARLDPCIAESVRRGRFPLSQLHLLG
ncbi:Hypothetical Protein FCC1311_114262 [Hondaea fermentalgiana]|uniref:Uncharacterized protein n=1 Tax=Hondaea fermentalgiana TaxID=2315210 RepID=A0A2R5H278_9STRA|nr:Hypothetical Protein FCC1311_114262 [Hondaea fermentalgiana]|eukprot:GBG35203.1 Hypothetical Protein FCC1311_114262 [Hondaea fermentalgiana]